MSNLVAKINNSSSATELSKSITVLDAIYWIEQAWSQVKDSTITKCFAKAGLGTDSEIIKTEPSESNESETWLQQLIEHVGVPITTAEYMNFDDSFPTEETYGNDWEQQLLTQHLNPATINVSTFKDQSDVEEETSASPVSLSEALNTLEGLRKTILYSSPDGHEKMLQHVNGLTELIEKNIVTTKLKAADNNLLT
ncbi:UNVERIFIED_CONTAM: hypothetical protein FKN15_059901 [Acipenser sinensis]